MHAENTDNTRNEKNSQTRRKCERCGNMVKTSKLKEGCYGYKYLCWTCRNCIEKEVTTDSKAVKNHELGEYFHL